MVLEPKSGAILFFRGKMGEVEEGGEVCLKLEPEAFLLDWTDGGAVQSKMFTDHQSIAYQ